MAECEDCKTCGRLKRPDCDGDGWLEAIGPCDDGSYITSRPCPNDTGNQKGVEHGKSTIR